MKCEACKSRIETTFLNKLLGTYVKDEKGKKRTICFECQKKFRSKEEILNVIK